MQQCRHQSKQSRLKHQSKQSRHKHQKQQSRSRTPFIGQAKKGNSSLLNLAQARCVHYQLSHRTAQLALILINHKVFLINFFSGAVACAAAHIITPTAGQPVPAEISHTSTSNLRHAVVLAGISTPNLWLVAMHAVVLGIISTYNYIWLGAMLLYLAPFLLLTLSG